MTEIENRIEAIKADITTLKVDAIVNAANERLLRGGGVDGAIRRKGGPQMEDDLRRIGRCPTGTAVLTFGYDLPASYVIHTVAPIWDGADSKGQEALFVSCYESAFKLADQNEIASIAFPAIGTGAYGWPAEHAAQLAFATVAAHLRACALQRRVIFCCFAETDRLRYQALIDRL